MPKPSEFCEDAKKELEALMAELRKQQESRKRSMVDAREIYKKLSKMAEERSKCPWAPRRENSPC